MDYAKTVKDFKPVTRHEISYRDKESDYSCCVIQTFTNNKGAGETTFKVEKKEKGELPTAVKG